MDRRSRQDESVVSSQAFDCQSCFGLRVADGVALVEDEIVPVKVGEKVHVISDDFIGRNQNEIVHFLGQASYRTSEFLSCLHRAVVDERRQDDRRYELENKRFN